MKIITPRVKINTNEYPCNSLEVEADTSNVIKINTTRAFMISRLRETVENFTSTTNLETNQVEVVLTGKIIMTTEEYVEIQVN